MSKSQCYTQPPLVPYGAHPVLKEEDSLFDPGLAHLSISHYVLNRSGKTLYMRDLTGRISEIPSQFRSYTQPTLVLINTVYNVYHALNHQLNKHEVERYNLKMSCMDGGKSIYVKELGVYLSTDKALLENMENEAPSVETTQLSLICGTLELMKTCPIRLMINDPSGTMQYVYAIIDERIYKIPVSDDSHNGVCFIQFADIDEDYSKAATSFNIEELRESLETDKECSLRVGERVLTLFPDLSTARTKLNEILIEKDKKTVGITLKEKEEIKEQYEYKLRQMEQKLNQSEYELQQKENTIREQKEELMNMRKLLELQNEKEKRVATEKQYQHQALMQEKAIQKEEARVQKSENDVKASAVTASASSLKAAAVIAPVVAGVAGAFLFGGVGSAVAAVSGVGMSSFWSTFSTTLINVASSVRSALSDVGTSIYQTCRDVLSWAWDGITSLCSAIFTWW